ncbi:MAG TPA: hypothetical protein VNN07_11695 [Candidatus Tectomicrobia bacterium]|nr:hypothetical protein [Candidatus Tectomicrobia bacterium]
MRRYLWLLPLGAIVVLSLRPIAGDCRHARRQYLQTEERIQDLARRSTPDPEWHRAGSAVIAAFRRMRRCQGRTVEEIRRELRGVEEFLDRLRK